MDRLDRSFIDGLWTSTPGERALALIDPATEAETGRLVAANAAGAHAAVQAARRAFDGGWFEAAAADRAAVLRALIGALEARRTALAETIRLEIGSPIDFARSRQVEAGLDHLRATLAAAEAAQDDQATDGPLHRVRFEPVGVAALITPWNWPLNQVALKLGAALAAGCAMVLKPSELSSRTALIVAEAMEQALAETGAPGGLFNLILGDGETGRALVSAPGVDAVSFTGSTGVGREIAAQAAGSFTRATLELGGKSPNLLFADCDLETAVAQGVAHCFRNAGQSCNAASRMLVERSVYARAAALAAAAAEETRVGAPTRPGPHLGPQVSAAQFDRVQGLIRAGQAEGARLAAGGPGRPEGMERGYYSRPTVFAEVTPSMRIWREEIFGPVLTLTPFETEAEAIRLANDTPYGLAAYVQTEDAARADRVARRLRAGMVQVNGSSRAAGAPFGGVKASGIGREAGLWGIRAFQEIKSISGVARAAPEER